MVQALRDKSDQMNLCPILCLFPIKWKQNDIDLIIKYSSVTEKKALWIIWFSITIVYSCSLDLRLMM